MQLSLRGGSRSVILGGLLLVTMAFIVLRLFYLQVIQHDEYVKQAAAEQVKRLTIPAKRGLIYALDGGQPVPLVMNQTVYTLFADPTMVSKPQHVLDVIRRVAGGNLRPHLEDLLNRKDSRYEILGKKLTRRQAEWRRFAQAVDATVGA